MPVVEQMVRPLVKLVPAPEDIPKIGEVAG
jgi:hypothetical protein